MDGARDPPKLPVRTKIYIDPDGTVHFGALFAELIPVAEAVAGGPLGIAPVPEGRIADPASEARIAAPPAGSPGADPAPEGGGA